MNSTQIRLHNVGRSSGFSRRIRTRCEALHRFHPHLGHCRVTVDRPTARGAMPVVVTIQLAVPGREIVVSNQRHVDANLALREAFDAARRRLREDANEARQGRGAR